MITKTKNTSFTNNKNIGKYADVVFSTVIQSEKEKEEQVRIRVKTHYFDAGKGKVVMLLHGAIQSCYIFKHNFFPLAEKFRVIMPDLPGHGYSGCPDMDYKVEDYSLFIEAFANALGIDKFSIVAYGQSAVYALDFCYYNPGRVEKLVLINPGSLRDTRFASAHILGRSLGMFVASRYAHRPYMRRHLGKAFFDRTVLYEKDIAEFCRPFENPGVRLSARMAVANFFQDNVLSKLSEIKVKTLFIEGIEDNLSDKEETQWFFEGIENTYIMKVRNCGAFPQFEKPNMANKGILQFLSAS